MRAPIILLLVGVGSLLAVPLLDNVEVRGGAMLVGVVCVLVAAGWLASEWYRRRKP